MEELEKSLSPAVETVSSFASRVWAEFLTLVSVPQAVAIGLTLVVAIMLNIRVRGLLTRLFSEFGGRAAKRISQTVSSIATPIVWVLGLWLALLVFGELGWKTALIRLVASLINAWVVIQIASTVIPSTYWARCFAWFAWSVAALNAIGQLDPLIRWMDGLGISSGDLNITLWGVVQGIFVTALLLWLALLIARVVQIRLDKSETLNASMKVLIGKISRIGLVILAVIMGMQAVGVNLTAFAFFSGALGLGIGLGMQRTVGNLVAGFTMLADRSIKPGDVIEVETGDGPTYGEVKTLGSRYVAVRTRAGTETLIPNEVLISNAVTNWSFSDKRVRRSISIGVAYNTDVENAMKLCVEAAARCQRVLKQPKPMCLLRGFGDSSVDLELRVWLGDPEDGVANISSEILLEVWKSFQEHQIEIPFPQRDLHIKSMPERI